MAVAGVAAGWIVPRRFDSAGPDPARGQLVEWRGSANRPAGPGPVATCAAVARSAPRDAAERDAAEREAGPRSPVEAG
jgi:hypothetical protein